MRHLLIKELKKLSVNQRVYTIDEDNDDAPRWATVVGIDRNGFDVRWDHNGAVDHRTLEDVFHFNIDRAHLPRSH